MSKNSGRGSGFRSWSVVTWILAVTITATIIQHLVFGNSISHLVSYATKPFFTGQVWRIFSYQLFHGHLLHMLFNMLGLFFLGRMAESTLGGRNLLFIYILGGIAGALAFSLWEFITKQPASLIGASASVLAVIIALIKQAPNQPVHFLFIPIPIKFKYIGWGIIAYNAVGLLMSLFGGARDGATSYAGHLGGIALGWFLSGVNFPAIKVLQDGKSKPKKKPKKPRKEKAPTADVVSSSDKETDPVYLNKQVDAILEKISEQGMQSLTPKEKKILERSSEKLSKKLDDK